MKMKLLFAATGLAVALLGGTSAQAQGVPCDNGRGVTMTDLGFRHLQRAMKTDPQTRRRELLFTSEPRIAGVRANGPAAGLLQNGDLVVAIQGRAITSVEAARIYSQIKPAEPVSLSVRRDGRVRIVTIVAGSRCVPLPPAPPAPPAPPPPPDAPPAPVPPNPPGGDELLPQGRFGFAIDCNDCGDDPRTGAFRFGQPPVVVRIVPGSPAARAGLRAGDRLTHVNGISLTSEAGWPRFRALKPGETARFTYVRADQSFEATLKAD